MSKKTNISETETVVKRILPYLNRRGYDLDDMSFEQPTADDGISRKYIDIMIKVGGRKCFIIEAKKRRNGVRHHYAPEDRCWQRS